MKNFILPKLKFDKTKDYVIYNWENSPSEYYKKDVLSFLHIFIKSKNNHEKILKKLKGPLLRFDYSSLDYNLLPIKEKLPNSDYSFLFASYKMQRIPSIIDWSGVGVPMKKDVNLDNEKIKQRSIDDYVEKFVK